MTRTQLLDARRNVRKEIVAYLSIVIIGLLASLSYLSITYSAATLKKDALSYFNTYGLWDLEVSSTLLMEEEDLEAIRALPAVAEAERVWQIDAKLHAQGSDFSVAVLTQSGQISRPKLLEGRLPEKETECAVEKELMDRCALALGQQISLDCKPISDTDPLLKKSFVITGVFQTPDHITFMIPVTPYVLVTEEVFNREALDGAFMKTRVRVAGTPANRYSDAYWAAVEPVQEAIEALGAERAPLRRDKLQRDVLAMIGEGQAKLDEAAEKLRSGREQLDKGWSELAEAAQILADGKEQLDKGGEQLYEAKVKLNAATDQLKRAKAVLDLVESYLDKGEDWVIENVTQDNWPANTGVSYPEFREKLSEGKSAVMSWLYSKSGYNHGLSQFREASVLLSLNDMNWYYLGEEYLDGVTRYELGKRQLEQGEQEYDKGMSAYESGMLQIKDARKRLSELSEGRWIVLNDRGNPGFMYAEANADKLSSLSMSFSAIFLVVGALVIYATIGRMVEQQRKLIGATKAMGLFRREVLEKYLYFACSATMLGVVLGTLLAWLPLQRVILQSYEKLLTYGRGTNSFLPLQSVLVIVGALAISVIAVYLGCGQLLRLPAIQLMQGVMPSSGRRKTCRSVVKNLYSHLILRNMRTDWSRVMVTIASIAGGCMLMVIGFTLRYGISGVPDRQFGGIQTYEAEVYFDAEEAPEAAAEIEAILDQNGLPHLALFKAEGVFEENGALNALTMIVTEDGSLAGYFDLRGIRGGEELALPDSGVLIPRRFHEYYGAAPGGSVHIYDNGMKLRDVRVADVFENYYGQLFFMTPRGYEKAFGAVPEPNCIFVKTQGMPLDTLRQKLAGAAGLVKVSDAAAERNVIEQFTASLNFVVWLMLAIAGVMACFIVANFTVTYIQRKTGELTLMRINGFRVRECVLYAAADLVVTTILGTLLGLLLGGFAGHAILRTTETPYIQMIRESAPQSYLYSALITCGFSLLTNSVVLRRIKNLKLSDMSS